MSEWLPEPVRLLLTSICLRQLPRRQEPQITGMGWHTSEVRLSVIVWFMNLGSPSHLYWQSLVSCWNTFLSANRSLIPLIMTKHYTSKSESCSEVVKKKEGRMSEKGGEEVKAEECFSLWGSWPLADSSWAPETEVGRELWAEDRKYCDSKVWGMTWSIGYRKHLLLHE